MRICHFQLCDPAMVNAAHINGGPQRRPGRPEYFFERLCRDVIRARRAGRILDGLLME
jgi:hypothetical protein